MTRKNNSILSTHGWVSPTALEWLGTVLNERWGGQWIFIRFSNYIFLRPAKHTSQSIKFIIGDYPIGTSELPCGIWKINPPFKGVIFDEIPTPGLHEPSVDLIKKKRAVLFLIMIYLV